MTYLKTKHNSADNPKTSCRQGAVAAEGGGRGGSYLVASSDTNQLVSRPDSKDGSHGEVGVHNGGTVQGVKSHTEPLTWTNPF